jgi:hypothetical protein
VRKWWNQREALDYAPLVERIRHHADYDIGYLTSLLRKDQRPDLGRLIERGFSA